MHADHQRSAYDYDTRIETGVRRPYPCTSYAAPCGGAGSRVPDGPIALDEAAADPPMPSGRDQELN